MVKMLRVDDRLLHGQIAVSWLPHTGADSILIANNMVMEDEMAKVAIKLAKPANSKLAIRSISGAAELLNDARTANSNILVIVRTISDALELVKKTTAEIKCVNIGGLRKQENGKMLGGICLTEEDVERLKEIDTLVGELELRILPSDSKYTVKDL